MPSMLRMESTERRKSGSSAGQGDHSGGKQRRVDSDIMHGHRVITVNEVVCSYIIQISKRLDAKN